MSHKVLTSEIAGMPRFISLMLLGVLLALTPAAHAATDPWIENLRITNGTFYPLVPDDYKDYTEFKWRTGDTDFSECWASLYDSDGNLLIDENTPGAWYGFDLDYACDYGSGNWLQWNGRGPDHKRVPTGTYTITVRYFDEFDQVVHEFSRKVTVATGTKWFKRSFSYKGSSFDVKRTRGNCRVYRLSGEGVLDCWGGRYAKAGYDFYVQYDLGIKDFKWWASGTRGCCSRGTVRKTGVRDRHDLDIDVVVTNWASYSVYRVGASWMAKDRI